MTEQEKMKMLILDIKENISYLAGYPIEANDMDIILDALETYSTIIKRSLREHDGSMENKKSIKA